MKSISKAQKRFLARGLSSESAEKIEYEGLNVTEARALSVPELVSIGLSEDEANLLRSGTRPPYSSEVVNKLIYDSAATCCICQNPDKPFIFHHILEWSEGGGNGYDNLVLLCLNDHGVVHSKNSISQNIAPDTLKQLKSKWCKDVAKIRSLAVFDGLKQDLVHWEYVNHRRLFELIHAFGIPCKDQRLYQTLRKVNMIDEEGGINDISKWLTDKPGWYMYQLAEGLYLHAYIKDLLGEVLPRLPIKDITELWSMGELSKLEKGQYVLCQKAFYTQKITDRTEGVGQDARIYRSEANISLEFQVDLWEATSSSSRTEHLSRHRVLTPILKITSIIRDGSKLKLSASCLAVSGSARIHSTPYSRAYLDARFNGLWDFDESDDDESA